MDVSALKKLAELYNVSADYLIGITHERNPKTDPEKTEELKNIGFSDIAICNLFQYKIASKFIFGVVESEKFAYLDKFLADFKEQHTKTKSEYSFDLLIELLRYIFSIMANINDQGRN